MMDPFRVSGVIKNSAHAVALGNADRTADAVEAIVRDAHLAQDPHAKVRCRVKLGDQIIFPDRQHHE